MTPTRIVRSREKGYKHPLGTLFATRPLPHGNPYAVKMQLHPNGIAYHVMLPGGKVVMETFDSRTRAAQFACEMFRAYLDDMAHKKYKKLIARVRAADYIACSCKLDEICHADIWIELATL